MSTVNEPQSVTEGDREFLRRCVDLAREALTSGDEPFGSLLVDEHGTVRFEDRNRVRGGDATRHPEFEIARWAAENLSPRERRTSVVYTSGEHCPMCSAAHAWVGLGRIVYASGCDQLVAWRRSWGFDAGPIAALPINAVAPGIPVAGPDPSLAEEVRALHARMLGVATDG
ncbi:nucleoside deaminase [Streptomyces sp. NBC_01005]|uniref:nucleoside deaminase n=1 Tax=unclassified Streptomyces TaxID=2593676 RepID=UPI002E323447|nr:nucleoside deaminase [Streptomyces sp. NBC_01362]WSW09438.1 nucleoside deaminase [Streptomyces sp. NBC_01005]WTC98944.1 nucleoside deaminase [Streptomyces sp. NBC_01650]